MLLSGKALVEHLAAELKEKRRRLTRPPGLGLIWVGDDPQTGVFVRAKARKAQELGCEFVLHHLEQATQEQIAALIASLNSNKKIDGIVLQLPLPKNLRVDPLINSLEPRKDIDALGQNSPYLAPTVAGIIALLNEYKINPAEEKTVILGDGRLVGRPLAKKFQKENWPFQQITSRAEERENEIKKCSLLIAATGVPRLVGEGMVQKEMVVIDGSGVDTDPSRLEHLVRAITPARGAIGPLTVSFLFSNLLQASEARTA